MEKVDITIYLFMLPNIKNEALTFYSKKTAIQFHSRV